MYWLIGIFLKLIHSLLLWYHVSLGFHLAYYCTLLNHRQESNSQNKEMKGKNLTAATSALQPVAIAQAKIYLRRYGLAPPNKLSLIFFWEFMLNSPIQDWCSSCKDHNYSQNRNKIGMTFVGLALHLLGYMN